MNQDLNNKTEESLHKIIEEHKRTTSMFIHELRNPLSLIKGTLQYIEMKHPETKEYKYWSQLFELVQDMENMMSDASQLNSCTSLSFKQTNLLSLIQGVIDYYMPQAVKQNKKLSLIVASECEPMISSYTCDAAKLKQALSNLIKNALEATNTGDSIDLVIGLNLESPNPMLSIQVNDNGDPIPQEEIDTIFHPFVTYKKGGSGVGLALTQRIVEGHKGSIDVISNETLTSFTILLPL